MNAEFSLITSLKKGVVEIDYNKMDGSRRKIRATMSPDHVPAAYVNGLTSNKERAVVWDLDRDAFRTVIFDHVVSGRPV